MLARHRRMFRFQFSRNIFNTFILRENFIQLENMLKFSINSTLKSLKKDCKKYFQSRKCEDNMNRKWKEFLTIVINEMIFFIMKLEGFCQRHEKKGKNMKSVKNSKAKVKTWKDCFSTFFQFLQNFKLLLWKR